MVGHICTFRNQETKEENHKFKTSLVFIHSEFRDNLDCTGICCQKEKKDALAFNKFCVLKDMTKKVVRQTHRT